MKMYKKSILASIFASMMLLSACDKLPLAKPKLQCNDEVAKQHIQQIFLDSVNEKAKLDVKDMISDGHPIDMSHLTSLMSQINVQLVDVRTVQADDKSSKKLCEANLTVKIPADLVEEADLARELMERESIQQQAVFDELKFENNTLHYNVAYSVQPTDDGQKIYGTLENADKASKFTSEMISDILWKPIIEQLQKQHQAELELEEAKYQAEQEKQAQTRAEYVAVLEKEAKQNLEKANTKLNLVWNAATAETRQELLPEQKTWLKKRELECKLKAQDTDKDDEKEIERLKCETSMTDKRTDELKAQIEEMQGG